MFVTGPQVVKAATGEEISAEDLGGATTHATKSGVAHFVASTEEECFLKVRTLLSYLPFQQCRRSSGRDSSDPWNRHNTPLLEIVSPHPNKPYDMKEVVEELVDRGSFLEVQKDFARNIIVGFSRIGGQVVGVVANQPYHFSRVSGY